MDFENIIEIDVDAEQGGRQGLSAYELYLNNGGTLSESEWLASLKGKDGENGSDGLNGKDGTNGIDGADGLTPTIGENGNWYIGDVDTGLPSRGEKGDKGDTGGVSLNEVTAITGELNNLSTEDKSNLVNAINELFNNSGGVKYFTEDTFDPTVEPSGVYFMGYDTYHIEGGTASSSITTGTVYIISTETDFKCILKINVTNNSIGELSIRIKEAGMTSWSKTATLKFSNYVTRGDNQTISGLKTFGTLPKSTMTPTDNYHLVNKKYVDTVIQTAIGDALGGSY